jgi:leucyl aminopeptidase
VEIKIASGNIREVEADAIILCLYEGTDHFEGELAEIDTALEGVISRLLSRGEIKGKPGQLTIIHSLGKLPSSRVVVCGMGKEDELNLNGIRKVKKARQ